MKKQLIGLAALVPLLAISSFPDAKADKESTVERNVKACFGVRKLKDVTADMYFNTKDYYGRYCKKARNHHRNMPVTQTAKKKQVCTMETIMVGTDHTHTLYNKIKNDKRFANF